MQNTKCYYWRDFLRKLVTHEGLLTRLHHQKCSFQLACAWNSVNAKTVRQTWRKLWPAVLTAEGAWTKKTSRDFMFTVHELVSMFEKLDPSNPECGERQVDVEEWIDADKRIAVLCTGGNENLMLL